MKSTALAASLFLGAALAVPPATPQPAHSTHDPKHPGADSNTWSNFRRAASNLFLPKHTAAPEKLPAANPDDTATMVDDVCPGMDPDEYPPLAGLSSKGRAPIDNAGEKDCVLLVQATIPWWRTLLLYNCECGDECPHVKRGCRLDALIEFHSGNTLLLYNCPPHCTHGPLSVNAAAGLRKRALDNEEEDACYFLMDDGINNAPQPLKDAMSWEPQPTKEAAPEIPICIGFTKKLYQECLNNCDNSPLDTDSPRCTVGMERAYEKMLKSLEDTEKITGDDDTHLAGLASYSPLPGWCDWEPLPVEDDGQHGECGNLVREFCRMHDCHDG